jgi:hypothetical protein
MRGSSDVPSILIAAQHPLTAKIAALLARRGDSEGVALARGLSVVDMLIADGWISREDAMKSVRRHQREQRAAAIPDCVLVPGQDAELELVVYNDSGTPQLAYGKEGDK